MITVRLQNGEIMQYEEGIVRYEGNFAIITDKYEARTAYPASALISIHESEPIRRF